MTSLSILIRTTALWALIAAVPASVAFIFAQRRGAGIAAAAVAAWLLWDALRAEDRLRRILKPSTIEIGGERILAIEDPSSHVFATHAFFSWRPTLWITRGALSLLAPEEIVSLLRSMREAADAGGLRFETFLTAKLVRATARIPSGFRDVLFFREKRTKAIHIRESARAALWTSWVLLLELFYLRRPIGRRWLSEEILRKLEAESRRCVPRLPAALSGHSAVSPWPDAFITLGRPCLLPPTAVNLKT